jgi:hypothetical protein
MMLSDLHHAKIAHLVIMQNIMELLHVLLVQVENIWHSMEVHLKLIVVIVLQVLIPHLREQILFNFVSLVLLVHFQLSREVKNFLYVNFVLWEPIQQVAVITLLRVFNVQLVPIQQQWDLPIVLFVQ